MKFQIGDLLSRKVKIRDNEKDQIGYIMKVPNDNRNTYMILWFTVGEDSSKHLIFENTLIKQITENKIKHFPARS